MSSTIKKNLIGQRFGMLEVIDQKRENNRIWCLCQCDCGNVKWIRSDSLTAKNKPSRSCGCQSRAAGDDLTGQKFGRLTAIRPTEKRDSGGSIIWECCCECGNTAEVSQINLKRGTTKSCGCLAKETKEEIGKEAFKDNISNKFVDGTNIDFPEGKRGLMATNKSGATGVCWNKNSKRWVAQINFKGERYFLGQYLEKEDAIKARKEAEEKLYKPFIEEHKKENKRKQYIGLDLTGKKIGHLTVIKPTDKRVRRSIVWECRCDCGNIIEVPSSHLVGEKYKHHCGCLDKPVSGKYPKRGTQKRLKEKVMSGVLQDVKTKKWITTVRKEGKAIIVGEFDTKEEALKALEEALKRDL